VDTACDNFRGHPALLWLPGAVQIFTRAIHERTRRFLNQLQWHAN
jgi:hypothetical protein